LLLKGKGIITDLQRKILLAFSEIPGSEMFYLTGGTALSEFYLAHRRSYDLDLFTTEKDFVIQFSHTFEEAMKKLFQVKTIRRLLNFAEFEMSDGISQTKVQIALDSTFRFGEPVDSDIGIKVNDYTDLIVDKLLAFFGRVEPRDAVDLFFILKNEDFWKLTELAKQKDLEFDLYWLAVALKEVESFPDQIELWAVDMIEPVDPKEIKAKFSELRIEILRRIEEAKGFGFNL
jgi:Domain of unknown function (DUF1814).